MVKHGISHAGAVLVSIIAGDKLSRALLQYWPQTEQKLIAMVAFQLGRFGINWPISTTTWLATVTLFGFVWGVAFKVLHSDR